MVMMMMMMVVLATVVVMVSGRVISAVAGERGSCGGTQRHRQNAGKHAEPPNTALGHCGFS